MALIDLWNSERGQLADKRLQQIIAFAGTGKLGDDSPTSREVRELLRVVPTERLHTYAGECLEGGFTDSGLALQDVVNQIGHRLGFTVTDGRYRGKQGLSGHDGLWRLPDGHTILVEVKTTDAYRIDLNVLAGYRRSLISAGTVEGDRSSILIVVARQDTGDLEAQIRGSRHAWDVRLISTDALLRLLRLKENLERPQIVQQIHALLIPREFTRLDDIVDVVFSTAEDAAAQPESPEEVEHVTEPVESDTRKVPKFTPVSFHEACARALEKHLNVPLVRVSKSNYSSADERLRITCSISKRHDFAGDEAYWFAFHPHYLDFLKAGDRAFAAFGCGSAAQLFLFPLSDFEPLLEGSYKTEREDRWYWHVQLFREGDRWFMKRGQQAGNVDVTRFFIADGLAPS